MQTWERRRQDKPRYVPLYPVILLLMGQDSSLFMEFMI